MGRANNEVKQMSHLINGHILGKTNVTFLYWTEQILRYKYRLNKFQFEYVLGHTNVTEPYMVTSSGSFIK